ncbi:MAG: excinuclease ABC subunit UvrA [Candidatus Binataceae bacterium]
MERSISIRGARTHNLGNLSLDLPHGRLTVVTGVSGSGKSSLVFDTLYAEGQRRYVQSLSTYARLFLERMERPDVDSITAIPPALALRQKNTIKNARSTVGTVTEINDYLRLLFAAVGRTICPRCDLEVTRDTVESAAAAVLANPGRYIFLAPFDTGSRSLKEAAAYLIENGYHRLHYNGEIAETADFAEHFASNGSGAPAGPLMVVIDRVAVTPDASAERVREALDKSFYLGGGRARVLMLPHENGAAEHAAALEFDRRFNCSRCGTAYPEPTPALFSANSPIGACPECEGFGRSVELDLEKVMPNPNLSLRQGLVAPWRTPAYSEMQQWMLKCARRAKIRTAVSFREMTDEECVWLLDGEPRLEGQKWDERWPGVRGFFGWLERKRYKTHVRILLAKYRRFVPCPKCHGAKLKAEALNVVVDGESIAQVVHLSVRNLPAWIERLGKKKDIATRAAVLLRELNNRVGYLNEVGLGYLTLERQGRTLSGGEAQRIHLASALGSLLSGTLYALDEPTVGLHAGDSRRLLGVLRHLRDLGNTVVVVEHDPIMIAGADYVVELGPGGGRQGGQLIRAGEPLTGALNGNGETPGRVLLMRALSRQRRFTKSDPALRITGATENNLRNLSVAIPLGRMVCVTGVSGSGKSTLVETVLYNNYLRRAGEAVSEVGACERIEGLEQIGEMVHMGQEMPTRSLRSNPATYLKVYDEIRKIFSAIPEARRLGVKARDFSFNVEGGRCDRCHGTGTVTIEMHFMADLEVKCDACDGRRFQSHILGLHYKGKNVNQVLNLTIDEAREFFDRNTHPAIAKRLEPLAAVGLGYLQLGQTTSTLSGGEAQRLKLARFLLADLEPPRTAEDGKPLPRMFLLDEPTTGLASSDIKRLLRVLARLVAEGNTLVVIEHNLEFIAHADYVIDLGPGGGDEGGRLVVAGDPLAIAANEKSQTGIELRRLFGLPVAGGPRAIKSALRIAAET